MTKHKADSRDSGWFYHPWKYLVNTVCYNLYTLFLFTYSDLKTMVFPSTAFALFTASAKILSQQEVVLSFDIINIFERIPHMLFWSWINCLVFNVNNQKLPHAVKEDELNKPWRPMPARRLNQSQATILAAIITPLAPLVSVVMEGGVVFSLLLIGFGYAYNDLRLGDRSPLFRNVLNSFGFVSFAAGTLEVAQREHVDKDAAQWLVMIGLIVLCTAHIQDLYDQVGDRATGRMTIPLIIGDALARYSVAAPVIIWSLICPIYWSVSLSGYVPICMIGAVIFARLLMIRTVPGDRRTFIVWNLWLVSIYTLPLTRQVL